MSADVETMFSARELPWHGLGTVAEDALTTREALQVAGLDWEVIKVPMYIPTQDKKSKLKVDGSFVLVRDQDWTVLSKKGVSEIYKIFQNREAFEFIDTLIDSGEAVVETAGSLRGGRTVFITVKLPKSVLIGGTDAHDVYLVLTTTHDGTGSVKVLITPIRVVCMNTLTIALKSARSRWSIAHNRTMKGRIQDARETLNMSFEYMDAFATMAEELLAVKMNDDQFYDVVQDLFQPHNKDTEPATELVMDLWRNSPTNGFHGTGWGGLNALSEFFEHNGRQRSLEARFGAITGWQEKFRTDTASRILELA